MSTSPTDTGLRRPPTLTLDIETSPNIADVWSLWRQNVSLSQIRERGRVIAFAAKWHGKPAVEFRSDHHDGHEAMIQRAHELLDEAQIVVHYNGTSFDLPHLRREFLLAGLDPHSPVKEVDLRLMVKSRFRFVSNKLDNVAQELGLGAKTHHTGHTLWVQCMAGDHKAWALMRKYNKQDVVLTEKLYDRLLPWIANHPSVALYSGDRLAACNRCGSTKLEKRGMAYTTISAFQQYKCNGCGGWLRVGRREHGLELRGVQ